MKVRVLTIIAGAVALSGCQTSFLRNEFCNAEPGQLFVGQKADGAAGLAIRQATGADEVRWAPQSSLTEPSASTPTVPETAITLPARIARVKPISSSNGDCAGMRCLPSAGSAITICPSQ